MSEEAFCTACGQNPCAKNCPSMYKGSGGYRVYCPECAQIKCPPSCARRQMIEDQRREYLFMKAGEVFIITRGSYSNYDVVDLFRTLKDFSLYDAQSDFWQRYPGADKDAIPAYLEKEGLAESVNYKEVFLGCDAFGERERLEIRDRLRRWEPSDLEPELESGNLT